VVRSIALCILFEVNVIKKLPDFVCGIVGWRGLNGQPGVDPSGGKPAGNSNLGAATPPPRKGLPPEKLTVGLRYVYIQAVGRFSLQRPSTCLRASAHWGGDRLSPAACFFSV
jgi:hypothetical protein